MGQQPADFAVIFDMDGVLVDSVPTLVPSYNAVLQRHGCSITAEDFREYNGQKLADIVVAFNKRFGLALETVAFREEINVHQAQLLAAEGRTYGPELALIAQLRANGVKMAVATASSRERAQTFLRMCGYSPFDAFVTGEDVSVGKPSPDIFLEAARRLGVEPSRCIVCEDARNGIEAARRAGMRVVAVEGSEEREFLEGKADLVVARLGDLSYEGLKRLFESRRNAY